jgi:hypothetical protein
MHLTTLIGDMDENFYQLGLKDRESGKDVHRDVKRMLQTSIKSIDRVWEEIAKQIIKNSILKNTEQFRHLKAYSEGMQCPLEDTFYVMLVPEIVSAMSKWAPGLSKGSLGCSSFFMRNENQSVVHGRILDFPLQGSFDKSERAILYDLNGMPKTLGFNAAGIPYPSITLMTEDGITLALHQKFTSLFNKDGQSIFELIVNLLKNANDKKSTLDFLKMNPSITTWGLYMSFKNGDVLAVDLMGESIRSNEFILEENQILYFGNKLEDQTIIQDNLMPLGFKQFNQMREEIAHKKINHFLKRKKRSETELIKMMSTPYQQSFKKQDYSHYCLDPLTPSSLMIMTMNPTESTVHYIDGDAPKVFRDNLIRINDAFQDPVINPLKEKKYSPVHENYYEGLRSLMQAQIGFDLREPQLIYHQLQFAIDHFENCIEEGMARFYFLVAQYIYETHDKVLLSLLHDFRNLEGKLPTTLNDHCLLFIGRLEKILNQHPTVEEDRIQHVKLREIYQLEHKIPRLIFHLTTRLIMIPRMDLMDIIYVHTT